MIIVTTPGGTKKFKRKVEENRSTILGAAANLSNDILGAGIAGIPYAVGQCGFVAGLIMIVACAAMTDKSLRLLVETAKYSKTPTYETLSEAAFGRKGFLFIAINMFVFSYGSMVGYLMMVKETLPYVFGIVQENQRRVFLFCISLCVMVPISSQRDMADLSKTSRMNVLFCTTIACLVAYLSPLEWSMEQNGGFVEVVSSSVINFGTIFAGIGIFSYTYLVQHSAFIIAGSLQNPTRKRWARVTFRSMVVCATVCLICGTFGYLSFLDTTKGNILDNFNPHSLLGNVARTLLGIVMLFIYPIEAFVSRHVCVVIFFTGQSAHDGDDSTVLSRADRRIALTVAIYILAVIPAIIFVNLGPVLSLTGTIGGSCLSYMGPGAVYIGIHGNRFMELANKYYGIRPNSESQPLDIEQDDDVDEDPNSDDGFLLRCWKFVSWYLFLMPIWYYIALVGSQGFERYKQEESLKQKGMSRIDSMRDVPSAQSPAVNPMAGANKVMTSDNILRTGSYGTLISPKVAATGYQKPTRVFTGNFTTPEKWEEERKKKEAPKVEDSQSNPTVLDFMIAVGFIIFGVVALFAGLLSLYVELFG